MRLLEYAGVLKCNLIMGHASLVRCNAIMSAASGVQCEYGLCKSHLTMLWLSRLIELQCHYINVLLNLYYIQFAPPKRFNKLKKVFKGHVETWYGQT